MVQKVNTEVYTLQPVQIVVELVHCEKSDRTSSQIDSQPFFLLQKPSEMRQNKVCLLIVHIFKNLWLYKV